jgi:hypothetical protein
VAVAVPGQRAAQVLLEVSVDFRVAAVVVGGKGPLPAAQVVQEV